MSNEQLNIIDSYIIQLNNSAIRASKKILTEPSISFELGYKQGCLMELLSKLDLSLKQIKRMKKEIERMKLIEHNE